MGYVKLVKNRNYYKRYKVRMRRRRECKTDYALRRRLITQDKRKYNAPKWRFIVRITNKDVICQVACSKMIGDKVLCAAYSHELKRYGLKVGLTNYAACYCTGLLLARRLLKQLKLHKLYKAKKNLDGKAFRARVTNINWKPGQKIYRPFKCLLDIGLARATTGARIFGALKGAVDGGLDIPHNHRRFPGFKKGESRDEKDEYQADVHADKIYGGHVRDYMEELKEKEPEKYAKQFSQYIAENIGPEDLKDLYTDVHKKIKANPSPAPKKERDLKSMKLFPKKPNRLTAEERRQRRVEKIRQLAQKESAEAENEMQVDESKDDE